ncbi:MAG: signal peptidase II [Patescibacteria group bacterium]
MRRYYYLVLFGLFLLDRFTKIYFIKQPLESQALGGFLQLQLNKNIAFSWPLPELVLYPLLIIIIVVIFWFWLDSLQKESRLVWSWGLLIIGAVSNLLDRLNFGSVIDFIHIPYFSVLNISDIYISLGVVWLLWSELGRKKT